jgi:hypothetical protein
MNLTNQTASSGKCRMVLTYDSYTQTLEEQKQKEGDIAELKAAVQLLTDKINADMIANEPSSRVVTDEKDVPKGIQFTVVNNKATAEITR